MPYDRILLTGFMGSGKTTIGRLLATRLDWQFLDLDQEIERRTNRTVPQIFAESGEPHFRHLETETLTTLLPMKHLVLALGGGAPEEPASRTLLEQSPNTAIIHLTAPLETLIARCQAQHNATARPNLTDPEAAARRYATRQPLYDALATHTHDTTSLTPEQTADAIYQSLSLSATPAPKGPTP